MITPKGYYCDVKTRQELPVLLMDEEEILERENLNKANTSQKLRAKALAEQAKSNGR